MSSDLDFIKRLDEAIGCMECGRPLPENAVSDYFCQQQCSEAYSVARAPSGRTYDYFGDVDDDEHGWTPEDLTDLEPVSWIAPPVWRLPRSTGDLLADQRALERAETAAVTGPQQRACAYRRQSLVERRRALWAREWRLPRSTGDFRHDLAAFAEADRTATTDEQRAACALRRVDLETRRYRPVLAATPGRRAVWGIDNFEFRTPVATMEQAQRTAEAILARFRPAELDYVDATSFGTRIPAVREGDTITISTPDGTNRYVVESIGLSGSLNCRRVREDDQPPIQGAEATEETNDEISPLMRALRVRNNRNTGPAPRPGRVRGNVPGARS